MFSSGLWALMGLCDLGFDLLYGASANEQPLGRR